MSYHLIFTFELKNTFPSLLHSLPLAFYYSNVKLTNNYIKNLSFGIRHDFRDESKIIFPLLYTNSMLLDHTIRYVQSIPIFYCCSCGISSRWWDVVFLSLLFSMYLFLISLIFIPYFFNILINTYDPQLYTKQYEASILTHSWQNWQVLTAL